MDQVPLSKMITAAQLYSDKRNSDFINTAEWTILINDAIVRYWDLVEQLGQDYYFKQYFFNIQSGTSLYDLPPDFFHLRGVDVCVNLFNGVDYNDPANQWVALSPYMFTERNVTTFLYFNVMLPPYFSKYRIQANQIAFEPLSTILGSLVRLSYTYIAPQLQNLTDTIDVINGYDQYIAKIAAINSNIIEESQVNILLGDVLRFESEIKRLAGDRNRDQPQRISDVNAKQLFPWGW